MSRPLKILVTILALLLPGATHARLQGKAHIDSLLKELSSAQYRNLKDTNKVQLLGDLAYSYKTIDPEMGIHYAQQEAALATELRWTKGVADAYTRLSLNHQFKYDYFKALEYGLKAMKMYEELGNKGGLAEVQMGVGNVYSQMGNYTKGLEYHLNALRAFEENHDKRNIAITQGNIGNIYQTLSDYPKALLYDMNALKTFDELDDSAGIARNLGNIGNIYMMLDKYPEALEYNFNALNIFEELGERNGQGLISGNIGEIYYTLYLDTSGKVIESKYLPRNKKAILGLAIDYLKKGTEICREINMLGGVAEFAHNLAQAYTLKGDFKEALKYTKEYNSVNDSIYSHKNIEKMSTLEGIKEKEIKEKELEVQRLKLLANKNAQRYYLAALAMLLIISGGLFRRFRTARKTKKQLEEKNRLVEAEKQNAEMLRIRAERSEQSKHQFLTNMSHEIRTPMNAVNGMTDLLLDKSPRPDQLHYLRVISKSSDILLHIINDILDLSKIEAGKLELQSIDFSLPATIKQVKETLSFRAEEKGLLLTAGIDDEIPNVLIGDPFRLNQILINLGGNAIKFTERGTVALNVTLKSRDEHVVTLLFEVTDTGIGIAADKIDKLFQNFTQVTSSDTRIYGGTGLGLSISKQLVELHGGTIKVESDPGKGSNFSFELTYPEGSPKRLQQKTLEEQKADGNILNGLRLLLVDDNDYNRMVAYETLRSKADVTIDEAVNGQQAIDMLKLNNYDAVLMDVRMPVMNGLDAARYIRAELPSPMNNVPIIAVTASLLQEDANQFTDAGMNDYLLKPFKAWQLIAALSKATGRELANIKAKRENKKTTTGIAYAPDGVTNLSYLEEFCDGDIERMRKFVKAYIVSVPLFTDKIKAALNANDLPEIATQVHALKPRLRLMGMSKTRTLGDKIEQQINGEDQEGFAANVELFITNTKKAVGELEKSL